jgi:hypothetical protein
MKILLLLFGCLLPAIGQFKRIDPPALPDSGMPLLTSGPDGSIYLAWTETTPLKVHALRFSKWTGKSWTPPETITQGKNWFVNWADFGSITVLPDRSMLAHWLPRAEGGGKFGYGIRIAQRDPGRPVWKQIHGMSLDEKVDYAGFLTFAPRTRAATYLAPPAEKNQVAVAHDDEHGHRKTARFIEFRADGTVEADKELDADVCSCCQTALGKTRNGWIAAYRDHLPGEIRDISIVRFADGVWTRPRTLNADGWKINGCPTDGPALIAKDSNVAIAWLTRAGNVPKVQLVLSSDEGRTFGRPIRIDSGNPLGRPSITAFDESSYLVTWLEKTASGHSEIRIRRITFDGTASEAHTVSPAPLGRASGFPKAIVTAEQIILAWRDERLRAVLLSKSQVIQSTMKDKK